MILKYCNLLYNKFLEIRYDYYNIQYYSKMLYLNIKKILIDVCTKIYKIYDVVRKQI